MKLDLGFLIALIIGGLIMTSLGYTFTTWQWWAVTVCVAVSNISGRLSD